MTVDEILKELTYPPKKLPREALRAADQFRVELTPHLLASLADASVHPEVLEKDPGNQLPFLAMYLLAIWCEPQAHPLLINFLRLPGDQALDLSGDIVTQDMFWILAQTCAGNTDQLEELVIDRKVNEWARAAAVNALTFVTRLGGQSQETLEEQFRRILQTLREPDPKDELADEAPLTDLASGVLELQLVALQKDVLNLFDVGRIDESMISRDEFDEEWGTRAPVPVPAPVTDVVKAVSWWLNFSTLTSSRTEALEIVDDEEDAVDVFAETTDVRSKEPTEPIAQKWTEPVPYRAPVKPGRNDPCSCGSGKKYKKCCGA